MKLLKTTNFKSRLLTSTLIPDLTWQTVVGVGAIIFIAPQVFTVQKAHAGLLSQTTQVSQTSTSTLLPTAKPRPASIEIASSCNPCNPCAAKKTCNPCAAANPCNPCAAKNPCNPCAAANPCNPCAAGEIPEITPAEAIAAYGKLSSKMSKTYAMENVSEIANYQSWTNISSSPYQSSTHGNRYVNNYANKIGAPSYQKFEDAGMMPVGSVLAKDSFIVSKGGKSSIGPMFIMEKMAKGFNASSGDWRYTMITPAGKVAGVTKGMGMDMKFCAECHMSVTPEQDSIMLLPEEFRRTF